MSKIEWTQKTWNPITGCSKVSPGCDNCYAERMSKRFAGRFGYPKDDPFKPTIHKDKLIVPDKWKKPCLVFVCSMGDLFHEDISFKQIFDVFITISLNRQHTYQILTKRPQRAVSFFKKYEDVYWLKETVASCVWFGVSAENQEQADRRIPLLMQIPTNLRFVSIEPMLGAVDLSNSPPVDWVICGGETGPKARPVHPEWVRPVRDHCVKSNVPFFFKLWGEYNTHVRLTPSGYQYNCYQDKDQWSNTPDWIRNTQKLLDLSGKILKTDADFDTAEYPVAILQKIGKERIANLLEDESWREMPEVNFKE